MNAAYKIIWNKCKECGFLQHKTHLRCLKCKGDKFESIAASGTCKLLTYTILKATPMEFRDQQSYALGVVEFENGLKALGQLTTKENLKTGIILKPIYKKICNDLNGTEVYSYIFKPLE
ncbi:MAG: OB-fold domain-containing protein [Candidatus Lokiarchaeota archaeon]|nr:OB-fold domain-containing protein [Candidatus Lokiarchaeota archaeon]